MLRYDLYARDRALLGWAGWPGLMGWAGWGLGWLGTGLAVGVGMAGGLGWLVGWAGLGWAEDRPDPG